jgi:hypothetical protein
LEWQAVPRVNSWCWQTKVIEGMAVWIRAIDDKFCPLVESPSIAIDLNESHLNQTFVGRLIGFLRLSE